MTQEHTLTSEGRRIHRGNVFLVWLVVLLVAAACSTSTAQGESLAADILGERRPSLQTGPYTEHDPFYISGNDDFIWWPGTGTDEDPYVIEGLSITSSAYCIFVHDTTAHFIIRNSMLWCDNLASTVLILANVANAVVRSCVMLGGSDGATVTSSVNCRFENCIIRESGHGIRMLGARNCTLSGNTAYLNSEGFHLENTNDTLLVNNTCFRNPQAGIRVSGVSVRNTFFMNSLGWNSYGGTSSRNAIDDGQLSLWDDNVSRGNSWNDYTGSGSYRIAGTAVSRDHFPSVLTDTLAPEVDHPEDITLEVGNSSPSVAWRARDRFPDTYVIFWNDEAMPSQVWNGDDIRTPVVSRYLGTHNCTLLVYDITGNTAVDTVMVSVIFNPLGDLDTNLIALASAVSVVLIIASILAVKALR